MKNTNVIVKQNCHADNSRGFTLIELLVVVLIVGILAAVAVPQYKVAVAKSHTARILPLINSLVNAQEVYYLAHGEYANQLSQLDIDIPAECTHIDYESSEEFFKCGTDFRLNHDQNKSINANYCPQNNHEITACKNTGVFQLNYSFLHRTQQPGRAGKRYCSVLNNSQLGKKICSTLSEFICSGC